MITARVSRPNECVRCAVYDLGFDQCKCNHLSPSNRRVPVWWYMNLQMLVWCVVFYHNISSAQSRAQVQQCAEMFPAGREIARSSFTPSFEITDKTCRCPAWCCASFQAAEFECYGIYIVHGTMIKSPHIELHMRLSDLVSLHTVNGWDDWIVLCLFNYRLLQFF